MPPRPLPRPLPRQRRSTTDPWASPGLASHPAPARAPTRGSGLRHVSAAACPAGAHRPRPRNPTLRSAPTLTLSLVASHRSGTPPCPSARPSQQAPKDRLTIPRTNALGGTAQWAAGAGRVLHVRHVRVTSETRPSSLLLLLPCAPGRRCPELLDCPHRGLDCPERHPAERREQCVAVRSHCRMHQEGDSWWWWWWSASPLPLAPAPRWPPREALRSRALAAPSDPRPKAAARTSHVVVVPELLALLCKGLAVKRADAPPPASAHAWPATTSSALAPRADPAPARPSCGTSRTCGKSQGQSQNLGWCRYRPRL